MSAPSSDTHASISPDSGDKWHAEGVWQVAEGIHRMPLPLPMDGLKAINVYVLETEEGLTLVDGGWAIPQARGLLERCLKEIGFGFGDIRRFLVTHVHRDHYTMARVLATEFGAEVALGRGDEPGIRALQDIDDFTENPFATQLRRCGAADLADLWNLGDRRADFDPDSWLPPTQWLEGDHRIAVGTRRLDAVSTPGHTPGHFVFAEQAAGLLFAGDHVLPTITPSIGFVFPIEPQPLGDFLGSLAKVRALPDLRILPAHGPVAPSSHTRVDELVAHHEHRLALSLAALAHATTAVEVAEQLPWTRHERTFAELDPYNQGMAALETKAHLDLLVAQGRASSAEDGLEVHYRPTTT